LAREITYSAKFKRDYVAALAVLIFFAIVAAEITLAVSVPAYLKRENAMALQVRRLRLLESFDNARNIAANVKVKGGEPAELERRLASWGLDSLAPYLREHAGDLSCADLAELQQTITELTRVLTGLETRGADCQEQKVDTSIYLNSLIPHEEKQ